MTKKKINILLVIAVLSLWAAVGYRFLKNYFPQSDIAMLQTPATKSKTKLVVERDTFMLMPLERDPFLDRRDIADNGNSSANRKIIYNKVKTNRVPKPLKTIVNKYWPDIQYCGYIKSNHNNELVLLKINGQLLRMHKNEKKNDVIIKDIYNDSIAILFNKEKKVFRRFKGQVTPQ